MRPGDVNTLECSLITKWVSRLSVPIQITKSIHSRGRLRDVKRMFTGRPLNLLTPVLIQKRSLGVLYIYIPRTWISCYKVVIDSRYLMSGEWYHKCLSTYRCLYLFLYLYVQDFFTFLHVFPLKISQIAKSIQSRGPPLDSLIRKT